MSKKRAFVKYTKSGIIVPGGLIITTNGGYPKGGPYYEVPANLCCVPLPSDNRVAYTSATGDCCPGGAGRCDTGVIIYLLQSCVDNPQIGCQVWADQAGTTSVANNDYFIDLPGGGRGFITTLVNGKVVPSESFVTAVTPCT